MKISDISRVAAIQKTRRIVAEQAKKAVEDMSAGGASKTGEGRFAAESRRAGLEARLAIRAGNHPSPQEIAERYAPILILPKGQYNLPADPEKYIENSRWRENRRGRPDNGIGNNTDRKTGNDFTSSDIGQNGKDNQFLDLDNDMRGKLGSKDAPVFYEFDAKSNPPKITYHIFYAYNDGPSLQNHEGDWERITLELDPKTMKPVTARYSAHEHNSEAGYNDIGKDPATGRPLVYVAGGSHANYLTPGQHPTEVPVFKDNTATDKNGDGRIDAKDGAVVFDTGRHLNDVGDQAWYPQNGKGVKWGEIGTNKHTSGPHGPSAKKGHLS